ncbi:Panacea domain-containing protein [Mesorhizobium sp. GR13]|uniref:Panacea domain-containing protein n=1 Tax=Mesorhizobium sp. GR13 TaxID=2562308 RepID=UPI0010BFBCE0|nr:Panacea domain-containing protein [Mesorhizobium sp. GR13]
MPDRAYDRNRLKALVHYVIWKAGAHPDFGATKLNKIAWFSDAKSYVLTGQSITGAPYTRQEHGPVPRDIMPIRDQLVSDGAIKQWKDRKYSKPVWCFRSLQTPDQNAFSSNERKTIDYWIDTIVKEHTAESASELSHDYGWEIAKMGETLPFYSVLAERVRAPVGEELEWAKKTAREMGLI